MPATMPHDTLARALFEEMCHCPIIDSHSHIDAHRPAARNLDKILGYYYYTELATQPGCRRCPPTHR
jgi:glucuronate isomerase